MRHISFLSLPTELRRMVKDAISPSDLRTHVCFYLSNPHCAALYDSLRDAEKFWELLCWRCGLGILPQEDPNEVSWREIAIKCIKRDGFCTHPRCGESLLDYNRERMRRSAEQMTTCEVLLVDDDFDDRYDEDDLFLDAHMVFGRISFRERCEHGLDSGALPVDEDAYLRLDEDGAPTPIPEDSPRAYLKHHPLVLRSFATAAPVYNMDLCDFCDKELELLELINAQSRAVTVCDVLDRLHKELDKELSVSGASIYVTRHKRCIVKKNWSLEDTFRNLTCLRSILAVCPIETLMNVKNSSEGAWFDILQH